MIKQETHIAIGEQSVFAFGQCSENESADPDAFELDDIEAGALGDDAHFVLLALFDADFKRSSTHFLNGYGPHPALIDPSPLREGLEMIGGDLLQYFYEIFFRDIR